MTLSNRDREIICKELKLKGIKSVILIGSRARCDGNRNSDYDLYVVVSTLMVPFIYKKIKRKETILKNMLGSNVSIMPMTLKRINSGNDLLLLKTKKQGKTLSGKDYLPEIPINNIADVSTDEIYSYLFSAAYLLIDNLNPYESIDKKCIYNTAKAIIYCAEIQLMMAGIFARNRNDIIFNITRIGLNDNLSIIDIARRVLDDDLTYRLDPQYFWFEARDFFINVFRQMNKQYLNIDCDLAKKLQMNGFKSMKFSYLKNCQFFALCLINKRHVSFNMAAKNIEKHFWFSLFWLVMSIKKDMSLDDEHLSNSYIYLMNLGFNCGVDKLEHSKAWLITKNTIIDYWPMACAKSLF